MSNRPARESDTRQQ